MAAIGHLGLRLSWLWDHSRVPSAELMLNAKFGSNRTNRFEVIQFLLDLSFSSAAILDFEKWRFWHFRCLGPRAVPNLVRIRRTVRELFKFLQISKWRPAAILFSNFTISGHGLVAGPEFMLCIEFGPDRINGSKVIEIFLSHRKCITGTLF